MTGLSGAGALYEFAIAGDCKGAALFVDVFSVGVFGSGLVTAWLKICKGPCSGFDREAADGKVDKGDEDRYGCTVFEVGTVGQEAVEVDCFALVDGFGVGLAP